MYLYLGQTNICVSGSLKMVSVADLACDRVVPKRIPTNLGKTLAADRVFIHHKVLIYLLQVLILLNPQQLLCHERLLQLACFKSLLMQHD